MTSTPQPDWRLTNQENYLKGATLSLRKFRVAAARPDWDHEHCCFCWVKIAEKKENAEKAVLNEAYVTEDSAHWICPACFTDFRARFGWALAEGK